MSKHAAAAKPVTRREAQRERILSAARACFRESGFNAASMASLAETAGMSPGLIYRYFENKNAIILALIEQQLTIARRRIRDLRSVSGHLMQRLGEPGDAGENYIDTKLYMEISAQATRDPQIAEALRHYDTTVCREMSEWLCRDPAEGGHGVPEAAAPTIALMLLSLFEGLILRGAREPRPDCSQLRKTLEDVIPSLIELGR